MPISANDIRFFLSGGTDNFNPRDSRGGAISKAEVFNDVLENIFDNVTRIEADNGSTEYRCLYIKNMGSEVWKNTIIYAGEGTTSTEDAIWYGVGTAPIGGIEQGPLATEDQTPAGVNFQNGPLKKNAFLLGDLAPGATKSIWLRRVVNQGAKTLKRNRFLIRVEVGNPAGGGTGGGGGPIPTPQCPVGYHFVSATGTCQPDEDPNPGGGGTGTGNIIYQSTSWSNGRSRTWEGHHEFDPDDNKIELAAGENRSITVLGDGYALQSGARVRVYVHVNNYNASLEVRYFPNSSIDNLSLRLRSRHNEDDPTTNRFGGYGAALHHTSVEFAREDFHNEHTDFGEPSLPHNLVNGTEYWLRYSCRDIAGGDVEMKLEIKGGAYGSTYVLAGRAVDPNPQAYMLNKQLYLNDKSYAWIRTNGDAPEDVKYGFIVIRNLDSPDTGGGGAPNPGPLPTPTCPTGYHYDQTTKTCVIDTPGGGQPCPSGQVLVNGVCVPQNPPNSGGGTGAIVDYTMAAVGDTRCNSTATAIIGHIKNRNVDIFQPLGDYTYTSSADCWFDMTDDLKSKVKAINIGNHDDAEEESDSLRADFLSHYNQQRPYSSYTFRNTFVLNLYTYAPFGYGSGSAQYEFAKQQLQAARANAAIDWIIVLFHKPVYTASSNHSGLSDFRNLYHPLFDQYKVDICMSGHVHNYQRTKPLKHNGTSTGQIVVDKTTDYLDNVNPIFFIVGSGGREIASISSNPSFNAFQRAGFGYLLLSWSNNGKKIVGRHYDQTNTLRDEFVINKTGVSQPPSQPPPSTGGGTGSGSLPPDSNGIRKIYPTKANGEEWFFDYTNPFAGGRFHTAGWASTINATEKSIVVSSNTVTPPPPPPPDPNAPPSDVTWFYDSTATQNSAQTIDEEEYDSTEGIIGLPNKYNPGTCVISGGYINIKAGERIGEGSNSGAGQIFVDYWKKPRFDQDELPKFNTAISFSFLYEGQGVIGLNFGNEVTDSNWDNLDTVFNGFALGIRGPVENPTNGKVDVVTLSWRYYDNVNSPSAFVPNGYLGRNNDFDTVVNFPIDKTFTEGTIHKVFATCRVNKTAQTLVISIWIDFADGDGYTKVVDGHTITRSDWDPGTNVPTGYDDTSQILIGPDAIERHRVSIENNNTASGSGDPLKVKDIKVGTLNFLPDPVTGTGGTTSAPTNNPNLPLYKFISWGDDDTTSASFQLKDRFMQEQNVTLYIHAGDGPYSSSASSWISMNNQYWNTPEKKAKFRIAQGNHDHPESEAQSTEDQIEAWLPGLNNPVEGLEWVKAERHGNVYLLILNSQDTNLDNVGSAQYNFIQSKLQEAKTLRSQGIIDWIIMVSHKSWFNLNSSNSSYTGARHLYAGMMREAQVDFMIHGHNHNLHIWRPIVAIPGNNNNTAGQAVFSLASDGRYDFSKDHGTMYIVNGNGGHEMNGFGISETENVLFSLDGEEDYGYSVFEIQGKQAKIMHKDRNGVIRYQTGITRGVDSGTGGGGGTTPTPGQTGTITEGALPIFTSGNTAVNLSSAARATSPPMLSFNYNNLHALGNFFQAKDWRNVEFTVYVKADQLFSNSLRLITRAAHLDATKNNGCGGSAYYTEFDMTTGGLRFVKQEYGTELERDNFLNTDIGNAISKWVGIKFIVYNLSNADVKMEIWVDKNNNNTWQQYFAKTDSDNWGDNMLHCGAALIGSAITWGSPVVFIGINGVIRLRYMSVREIVPPPG